MHAESGEEEAARTSGLPTGTVTFLFTDIEGSTRLVNELATAFGPALAEHHRILREAIAGEGQEVSTEGDAFFAVFPTPAGAVRAAVSAQRALAAHPWPDGHPFRVRMGLHTGEGVTGGDSYVGMDVNRAARIAAAGHGGEVLISGATRGLVESVLPDGVTLRSLGEHRLKDLPRAEHLHQVVVDGLPADFPPPRSLASTRGTLPTELTSFVGREREIREATELLRASRLVTLTGPGGTGKTRLALRVAAGMADSLRDGAYFVDLAPIDEADLVPSAVAQALGVTEEAGRQLLESIIDHLRDRDALLVLDNFEQVAEAAPAIHAILAATERLRILVTSRVVLRLSSEREYRVPPLSVPAGTERAAASLSRYEAVALFVERARAVTGGDFTLTDDNAAAVAQISARVDGLPLAIELAASRLKLFSPEALLQRLDRRLSLLTGGARDAPERQRTLRATIAWSYELLEEPERRLLERLSMFSGGWRLEAAEAVGNPADELGIDTLDGISSLVDKSLVRAARAADGADGEPRFSLLETIREFGADQLARRGDRDETARRHAANFLRTCEEAEPQLVGPDQAAWLDRIQREHGNIRAALEWAIETGDAETGMRIAGAIWRFWQQRGLLLEGLRWSERVLAMSGPATEGHHPGVPDAGARARLRALAAAGGLAYWRSDWDATERYYTEALALARRLGDRPAEAQALYNASFVPMVRDDLDAAELLLKESGEASAEVGDHEAVARTNGTLGWLYMLRGDYRETLARAQAALDYFRRAGNQFEIVDNLASLGQAHRLLGNLAEAREYFLETLSTLEESQNLPMTGRMLWALAATASSEGRHAHAMRLWGAVETLQELTAGIGPPKAMRIHDAVGAAREAIGDAATEQALAEGRQLTTTEAIALARQPQPD